MKLYLAGPITGIKDYVERFREGRVALRERGYEVICPVEGCDPKTAQLFPWDYWMRRDIRLLLKGDGVALLKGWELSRGALLEQYIAEALTMPTFPLEEWLGMEPAEQLELLQRS